MPSPICERFARCLGDLVEPDGLSSSLGPDEMRRLREHGESCSRCRSLEHGYARTLALLRALPRVAAPEGFADRVRARPRPASAPAPESPSRLVPAPVALAAAALLVVSATLGLLLAPRPAPTPASDVSGGVDSSPGASPQARISSRPDGSELDEVVGAERALLARAPTERRRREEGGRSSLGSKALELAAAPSERALREGGLRQDALSRRAPGRRAGAPGSREPDVASEPSTGDALAEPEALAALAEAPSPPVAPEPSAELVRSGGRAAAKAGSPASEEVLWVRVDGPAGRSPEWQALGQSLQERFGPSDRAGAVEQARTTPRSAPGRAQRPAVDAAAEAPPDAPSKGAPRLGVGGRAVGDAGEPPRKKGSAPEEIVLRVAPSELPALREAVRAWAAARSGQVLDAEPAAEPLPARGARIAVEPAEARETKDAQPDRGLIVVRVRLLPQAP